MDKKYQNIPLPAGSVKIGETPYMTEKTVFTDLLKNHMAPKGKHGYIVVKSGELKYIWNDDLDNPIWADVNNPILIFPERLHFVVLTGKVEFKVEFYKVPETDEAQTKENVLRPGEEFLK